MTISDRPPAPARSVADATARLTLLGHDLRAAVSDIIGGLRLIPPEKLEPETRVQMERIRASGEMLAQLMEEGLAMLLGEDEFAVSHPTSVELPRLLHDAEMRWRGRASEKGLDFRLTVAPDVPDVLALDRIALDRVLSNALSNAMKYTDAGTVRLDVDLAPTGALRLAVTDQGPGFSAEALAKLFEYGGRPTGAVKPGQGLGMHITRSMTGRLGGTIIVENRPEGGARVTLELPPASWTDAGERQLTALPDLSHLTVLVAEDNATNRTIIGHMLSKMGARYEIAEDGVDAADRLARRTFDLALIDIEMPGMSGFDVIRGLRARAGANRSLPVIAITAYVLRANRDAIYAAGADAILAKPFAGIETFGTTIAGVLGAKSGGATALNMPAGVDHPAPDLDRLLETAGLALAPELIDRLCEDLRAAERDLIARLSDRAAPGIRACAHIIIALAGAVGSTALYRLAHRLNAAAHAGDVEAFGPLGTDMLLHLDRLITCVEREKLRLQGK